MNVCSENRANQEKKELEEKKVDGLHYVLPSDLD